MVAHPIAQGGQLLKRINGDACGVPWGCEGLLAVGAQVVVEEFITSGNWRGKHKSLSRGAGADCREGDPRR